MAGRVGAWLAVPANAERVTAQLADLVRGALAVLSDDDVQDLLEGLVLERMRRSMRGAGLDFASALDTAIDTSPGTRRLDMRPGVLMPTGQPLDVALEGDGFFVVQTAAGATRRTIWRAEATDSGAQEQISLAMATAAGIRSL